MILKLNSGIAAKNVDFMPGDIVEWNCDADCERLIKTGLATKATPAEIKAAEGKVRSFTPAKPRPEDAWPPKKLKQLPRDDAA